MRYKKSFLNGILIGLFGVFGIIVIAYARLDNPIDTIWSRSGSTITTLTSGDTLSVSNLQVNVLSTITTQMTTGTLTVSTTADAAFLVKQADPSGLNVFNVDTNGTPTVTVSGTLQVGNGTNEIAMSYTGGAGIISTDTGALQINPGTVVVNFGGTTTGFPLIRSAASSDSAAAFSFVGDQDTGAFWQAADSFGLTAGGVEMLTLVEATSDELVVNQDQLDVDFRVESDTQSSALFVDAALDLVMFGSTVSTTANFAINLPSAANTTTTVRIASSTNAACLVLGDNDRAGLTYCTALNGVLTCSTASCE